MATKLIIFSCLVAFACASTLFSEPSDNSIELNGTNYVVGGTNAGKGEFPYQISLQIRSHYASFHTCGGTIIKSRWILTAGHCVWNTDARRLIVKAGKVSLRSRESSQQVSYVQRIFIHHLYRGGVGPFDLALMKLSTPFHFDNYVKPINLPKAQSIPHGMAMLSGWGSVSRSSRPIMPDILQKVALPILNINKCFNVLQQFGAAQQLHSSNVCTGPLTGQYNVCSGDSGGPLAMKRPDGTREIIGVVSWGFIPCSKYGAPSVFVRVSAFIDWIHRVTSNYN